MELVQEYGGSTLVPTVSVVQSCPGQLQIFLQPVQLLVGYAVMLVIDRGIWSWYESTQYCCMA